MAGYSRLVKLVSVSSLLSDRQDNGRLVVLLLGETGSGKSTLVNYLTSYFKGGTLSSPRIAIPTQYYRLTESYSNSEKDINDRMKSKTAACTNYDFDANGRNFRFIDSPGLSDTDGVNKDDEHIERITQAAERAGMLSGMVVVINGTCSRATVNLRNSLSRLRGILPDILADNLIIVLTNCLFSTYNFDFSSLQPWKIKQENIFFVNNSALSRDPRIWQNNDNLPEDMEHDWERSMLAIDDLLAQVSALDSKSTAVFRACDNTVIS